nr:EF-hand calcium-binding domain-containing protein 4A [Ipomoea batatas]
MGDDEPTNNKTTMLSLANCFNGCGTLPAPITGGQGTRIWNLSDKPIELQVRVGSILKKAHSLKPGSSKRFKSKNIYKNYMPGKGKKNSAMGMKTLLYYYDETCHPYIWIHDSGCDFSRMVKQQYISLEDLRDCSEIRIFRDHQRGCIAVRKKPRGDLC